MEGQTDRYIDSQMHIQVDEWTGTHTNNHTHRHKLSLASSRAHTTHPPGPNNQAPSIRTNSQRLPGQAPSLWKPSLYSKPALLCLVWRFSHTANKDPQTAARTWTRQERANRQKVDGSSVAELWYTIWWHQHKPTLNSKRWGFWSWEESKKAYNFSVIQSEVQLSDHLWYLA